MHLRKISLGEHELSAKGVFARMQVKNAQEWGMCDRDRENIFPQHDGVAERRPKGPIRDGDMWNTETIFSLRLH